MGKHFSNLASKDFFIDSINAFYESLKSHQELINRLNVYPVPDGDTGTNMFLTIESVIEELKSLNNDADIQKVLDAIAHGSLMGARGNSGIILSQILRALTSELKIADPLDAGAFVAGFEKATLKATEAVGNPVEGTILTVMEAASEAAKVRYKSLLSESKEPSLSEIFDSAREAASITLKKTPELLPVLAQSGVVDAGGAGLVLFFDALASQSGLEPMGGLLNAMPKEIRENLTQNNKVNPGYRKKSHISAESIEKVGDLRYEVMFLLEASDEAKEALGDVWKGLGDSIVIVGGDGIYNCHIHTGDIGQAIEAGIDAGKISRIRVTDLLEQVEEEAWVKQGQESNVDEIPPPKVPCNCAVVAVATGEGIKRIFYSLGVSNIVVGFQTMNPSTKDILRAIDKAPSSNVIVLPNNKNIFAVSYEAKEHSNKNVEVIETESVMEGFASLLEFDPQESLEKNVELMRNSKDTVLTGEVTQAVRDAFCDIGKIEAGDWLGLSKEGIQVIAKSLEEAASSLIKLLANDDHELVTLIEGEGSSAKSTRAIESFVQENFPGINVEIHYGGQPHYPYLISIE